MGVRAVGRRDHIPLHEGTAHADGDRLLADRDVQESSQVTGPETLLDLLLETADEEHLPQDVQELLTRQSLPLLGDSSHGPSR